MLLKTVITAFPSVSLPFLAVPLRSHRTVAIREGPFKAHVPAFLLDQLGSLDVCSRLNLSLSDLYSDLNGLTNVVRKLAQALQDLWCMIPSVNVDDGRRFERWCTYGSGTMQEETSRWYLMQIAVSLYDGGAAQNDHESMTRMLNQFRDETILKVSCKALSFCCASAVFLSKTVPFLAVPL
eukprot:SAG22_NODE_1180_length_5238_cov_2.463125_5_plen_181_part_00